MCHPLAPCGARCSVEARVERNGGTLRLEYLVKGDIETLRIPPPSEPQRTDELWKHTCCELFVARAGEPGYLEFNFSPSGEWAAYAFRDYRERIGNTDVVPHVRALISGDQLSIEASMQISGTLKLGLSAVLEEKNGALSYWALRHAPGKPDFHHPDAFAFEIDEARA